ncbi:MAG TPA: DUF1800 domain-containing protein [Thermoanaerobaculia bacterium]
MRRVFASAVVFLLLAAATTTDSKLTERQRAMHALNRLAFGPRPGDVDRVMKDGLDVWIDQQLHPEAIPDRSVEGRLQQYPTLQMANAQIMQRFYAPIVEMRKQAKNAAGDAAQLRQEMRANIPPDQRPQRVMEELVGQRILRAADSDRQLNEVMVDFWLNHFNVFAGKGIDRFLLTSYERDTIRPRIWGRFEDLLMATAKSPAMLFYLDNARSVAAPENRPRNVGPPLRRLGRLRAGPTFRPPMKQNANRGGLNENYAREIMELHSLGVDGGYTQKDVTELARVLTGWTIDPRTGAFLFRPQLHDAGSKTVLGVRFASGGGMEEGERMIHILAHHPATAHRIASKLCQRLVSDDPPPALVDRVAKKFLDTDGDLRQTVKAVIDSPEFWDPKFYRAKVKSPFEYVISAVRAVNGTIDNPMPIARALQQIGEPLYGAQPPTGYSDKADAWVNTGALLNRLNFALALAANKLPGLHSDVVSLVPSGSVDALAVALTGGNLTDETRNTIKERNSTEMPMIAGLILGSPEFQRQ